MTNAEIIKAIRENEECNNCSIWMYDGCNTRWMALVAADAIEALMKENKQLKRDKEYDEWLHNDRPCPDFAREE